jgi:cell cycle checkpoint protein
MGGLASQSQVQVFEDFLLRANKYPTLQIFGEGSFERKLIIVEDYPNIFLRDSSAFHNILR